MQDMDNALNVINDVLSGKLSFILGYGKQEGKSDFRTVNTSLITSGVYKAVGLACSKKMENVTLYDKIIFEGPFGKINISVYDVIDMFNYYVVKENSSKLFSEIQRDFFEQQTIENAEDTIQTFLKHDTSKLIGGIPYPDSFITYDLSDIMVETESIGQNYSIIPVASSIKALKELRSIPLGISKQIITKESYEEFLYQDEEGHSFDEYETEDLNIEWLELKRQRNRKRYLDYYNKYKDDKVNEFNKNKVEDLNKKIDREKKRIERNPYGNFAKKKKYRYHKIVKDAYGNKNIIRK